MTDPGPQAQSPLGEAFVPEIRPDIARVDLEYESVLWSSIRSAPVAIDPIGRVLLDVVDGAGTVGEIADDVADVVGVSRDRALQQVIRAIRLFDDGGILATSRGSVQTVAREVFLAGASP